MLIGLGVAAAVFAALFLVGLCTHGFAPLAGLDLARRGLFLVGALALLVSAGALLLPEKAAAVREKEGWNARFSRLGLNVVNLGNYDPAQLLFSLSRIEQDDLIVLFSFFPYTQLQIALAQFLHTQWGINVLCFTDNVSSPGAKFADVVLTSSTRSPVFFNSLTAPISQINVLASMYVSSYQEEYSRYNEKLSQLHQMIAQSLPEAEHWLI